MTTFTENLLVAGAMLLAGAFFLWRALRREGWKRRVLSWVGVVLGVVFLGFSGFVSIWTFQERHTLIGPDHPTAEELARPVEPFPYRLLADDSVAWLPRQEGDVILLNLWATWCGPCIKEMPYLEQLQQEYADAGLVVVTLTNEDRETALTKAQVLPSNTVNAYAPDQGAMPQPFRRGFRRLPTSYVIGPDGLIREFFVGSRDFESLVEKVEPHLAAE